MSNPVMPMSLHTVSPAVGTWTGWPVLQGYCALDRPIATIVAHCYVRSTKHRGSNSKNETYATTEPEPARAADHGRGVRARAGDRCGSARGSAGSAELFGGAGDAGQAGAEAVPDTRRAWT